MRKGETELVAQPTPEEIWKNLFEEVYQRLKPLFERSETRERVRSYLHGLLSPIKRKNSWQLAEEAGEPKPYGMQYFLDRARWDAEKMRDILQEYVREKLGDENGLGALDETGFLKKGNKSVGVQRQYSGTAGRIENCQIGVFLSYTSPKGHTLIDRELYLPKSWVQEPERCQEADIPEDVKFATKPGLAIKMIKRALNAKLPISWFVGDSVYGSSRKLRAFLEEQRKPYALAVKCKEKVVVSGKLQRVDELAAALGPNDWQCLSAGAGSKGPRLYNWAGIELENAGIAGWSHFVVIRQNMKTGEKAPETAYVLVFAPVGTTLQKMVEVIGNRWTVEECFKIGKSEVGLNEYEVRSWQGWYRHITLCMVAMTFLAVLRWSSQTLETSDDQGKEQPKQISEQYESSHHPSDHIPSSAHFSEQQEPSHHPSDHIPSSAHLPLMIPLSIPEIQKLFYYIVSFKPLSTLYRVAWSLWRRIHQAWARFYHYRRRILDSPSYLQL
jgi:SRSO17 transposase